MKKIILTVLSFCSLATFAQEEVVVAEEAVVVEETTVVEEIASNISINGFVDTYFRTNLTAPNNVSPAVNPGTSFAQESGFALGTAALTIAYDGEKAGFVADLAYGERAVQGGAFQHINQAYVYLNISDKLTATMGKFNTFLGYEVIPTTGNFNYSTSYLFSNGPFSHTGLKFDYAVSEDFSVMLAVMNDTDDTGIYNDPTSDSPSGDVTGLGNPGSYGFGAQLGYKGQYLNFILADTSVMTIDYTGGFDLTDTFFLGINAAYKNDSDTDTGYYGAALYPQYSFSDTFGLGLRAEYFNVVANIPNTDDANVVAATLTGRYSVGNLTIIPEFRYDGWSNATPYIDNDSVATDALSSFLVGAVYAF